MSIWVVLSVMLAGALGSLARYGISLAFLRLTNFPRAVLVVNVLGCLIGGTSFGLAEYGIVSPELKLIIITGIAGGLTTFSTWSVETVQLLESGRVRTAVANVLINLVLGIAVAFAAYAVVYFLVELNANRP